MKAGSFWLVLVMLAAPCAHVPPEQPTPTDLPPLYLYPTLENQLFFLASGLDKEIALCLYGAMSDSGAVATSFRMPEHVEHSTYMVRARTCPDSALARWHVHPGGREHAHTSCYLSAQDVGTWNRGEWPYLAVGSGDLLCWWSLDQRPEDGGMLPVRGQVKKLSPHR